MKTPAAASAYKNMWHFMTVKEALDQLKEETGNLSDDEKRDLKGSLEKTLDGVTHDNIPYTGQKAKVVAKLRALTGAL
jgi:uncharacterized protein YjbJ (UPF0337 family)